MGKKLTESGNIKNEPEKGVYSISSAMKKPSLPVS